MSPQIPKVVASYFEASNANDIEGLMACFSPEATVSDENKTHRGAAEIKGWAEDVRRKFQFKTEPLRTSERADGVFVTAKLSGSFPGSPVDLDFTFTLDKDKITSLLID